MRKFAINVNGNQYEVEVEEIGGTGAPTVSAAPAAVAPAASADAAVPANAETVNAPMPGNILDVKVAKGDSVNEGDVIAILEAMKMENEIVAPKSGTVASINVAKGATVDSGDVIASIA